MASESPPFWWKKPDWRAYALYPLSRLYGAVAADRLAKARRESIDAPVLCVGNFTVGGTGKTPVAIALAQHAAARGLKPGFLSRGHGGSSGRPHLVDARHDLAKHVGDEPLLLAEHAPTAVTRDRAAGARLLIEQGCDLLIMDDGFQSARIRIDHALIVVDARYGVGNGHVIPGGPLRARILDQLPYASGIVRIGRGDAGEAIVRLAARANKPTFDAAVRPREAERFRGRRFLAFAGIGHPDKFYETLRSIGADVVRTRSFPDHHVYQADDLADLIGAAAGAHLGLVTTSKDAARLANGAASADIVSRIDVLHVEMVFDNPTAPDRIIDETIRAWRARRLDA